VTRVLGLTDGAPELVALVACTGELGELTHIKTELYDRVLRAMQLLSSMLPICCLWCTGSGNTPRSSARCSQGCEGTMMERVGKRVADDMLLMNFVE
jgi:hypothetical protein